MSAYNPPGAALVDGNPFAGADMDNSFDQLSTAINGAVESTNNLVTNNDLPWFKFHDGAVSETFTTNSVGKMPEVFNVIAGAPAAPAPSEPWGNRQNSYDVVDASVDFYLHKQADCRFEGCAELARGKDSWNSNAAYPTIGAPPVGNSYEFVVSLIVDGVVRRSLKWEYLLSTTPMEKRGFPMDISFTMSGGSALSPGRHSAFLRLDCFSNLELADWSPAPEPMLTQFISNYRFLSVHAVYI